MPTKGGYNVIFEKNIDEKYLCPLCKKALREPVQTQCGHRFCNSCIEPVLITPNPQCPIDKMLLSRNEVFKDVCCKREVLFSPCYCIYQTYGCKWKKELLFLEEHQKECEYREVPCKNQGCGEIPSLKHLKEHMRESCRYRKSLCPHCGKHVREVEMEDHLQNCEKLPIRELEKDHIENHCEAAEKPCKFKYVGCLFEGKLEDLNQHYDNQEDEHLKMTVQFMETTRKEHEMLKARVDEAVKKNEQLEKQLADHRETLASTSHNLRSYQSRLNKAEKMVNEHKNAITQIRERTEDAASSRTPVQLSIPSVLRDQEEKLNSFGRELARFHVSGGGLPSLSSSSLTLDRRLDRNEQQLALHDIQLAEHDLKIQMLEATSYNGTYTWKIDEFSRRDQERIIGKTPSIYSPPFYVGRYGYKVCARVYPNGYGMGKGTHLSLFFVIMKGEYDALLPWPFRQKVTFKLLDQDRLQDVTDTFRPDPNSSSFKRPTSNMNIASGCPLFVSQQELQSRSYVKDDTLFIKIIVETAGL